MELVANKPAIVNTIYAIRLMAFACMGAVKDGLVQIVRDLVTVVGTALIVRKHVETVLRMPFVTALMGNAQNMAKTYARPVIRDLCVKNHVKRVSGE